MNHACHDDVIIIDHSSELTYKGDEDMRTASIIINLAIFIATFVIVVSYFRKDGQWDVKRGLSAFRFFTVLSNVFCAIAALVMAICQLRGGVPRGVMIFKYLGTLTVTVTMFTVLFFLGPTQGYAKMLKNDNFYMHLIGPLLAIVSFCFLEKVNFTLPMALLGLIPVLLYGAVYLYKVIYAPEGSRWEDFYGFNANGKWPVMFSIMILGTLLACILLWLI